MADRRSRAGGLPGSRAANNSKDCIEVFEDYGWDGAYHAFREWHGWNVEVGSDPKVEQPAGAPTEGQKVLMEEFSRRP